MIFKNTSSLQSEHTGFLVAFLVGLATSFNSWSNKIFCFRRGGSRACGFPARAGHWPPNFVAGPCWQHVFSYLKRFSGICSVFGTILEGFLYCEPQRALTGIGLLRFSGPPSAEWRLLVDPTPALIGSFWFFGPLGVFEIAPSLDTWTYRYYILLLIM